MNPYSMFSQASLQKGNLQFACISIHCKGGCFPCRLTGDTANGDYSRDIPHLSGYVDRAPSGE